MTDNAETRWESHNEAGRRLFGQGDHAAAEQEFIAAIREATSLGADNVRLASSLSSLGQIKYRQKDLKQAEALFRRALAIRERVLGSDHFSLVQAINNLATLHYSRGELDHAAKYFARALEICDKNLGEKHPDVAVTLNNLARLHFRQNDFVAAAPLLMRLLAIKQEAVGAHHPEVAVILTSLAKVRLAEGQHEDAEQLARRALVIREEIYQAGDPAIATSLETLAEVMAARGLLDDEQQLRRRVAEIRAGAPAQSADVGGAVPPARVATPAPSAATTMEFTSASITADHDSPPPAALHQRGGDDATQLQISHTTPAPAPAPAPVSAPAPAVRASGAHAAAQAVPPLRERTTRSASLPWIEPPTSPALRRPNVRPITAPRPVRKSPTPIPTARDVTAARRGAAPLAASTPLPPASRPRAIAAGPVSDGPHRARREVIIEARERRKNHSGLKVAIAAVVLLGCGAGAWGYFAGIGATERITSSAGAALDPAPAPSARSSAGERAVGSNEDERDTQSGARGENSANPAVSDSSALTASSDPAYGGAPPAREAPPAAVYGDDSQSAAPRATQRAPAAPPPVAHDADSGEMAGAQAEPTPDMSRINVDRITTAIGANAKAHADSLGLKTITVKPPDFGKPKP